MSTATEIINALSEKFGIALNWGEENIIPKLQDLTQKFVKYEILTSIATIVILIVSTAIVLCIAKWLYKKYKEATSNYNMDEEGWLVGCVIGITASIIMIIVTIAISSCQIFDIITATTIPEAAILNYISNLTK